MPHTILWEHKKERRAKRQRVHTNISSERIVCERCCDLQTRFEFDRFRFIWMLFWVFFFLLETVRQRLVLKPIDFLVLMIGGVFWFVYTSEQFREIAAADAR